MKATSQMLFIMAKTRAQKEKIVSKVEGAIKEASASVFVHFTGISVGQETKMRRGFRAEGVGYTVAKKSLIRRALASLGYDHASVPLSGEVAIAYNTSSEGDPTTPASRIVDFAKEFGTEKLTIIGGVFQGTLMDAVAMNEIGRIPPLPVLRGMFVNVINAPIQRLVIALDRIAQTKPNT